MAGLFRHPPPQPQLPSHIAPFLSVGVAAALAGSVAAQSALTGALTTAIPLAGTIAAQSNVSAQLTALVQVRGTARGVVTHG